MLRTKSQNNHLFFLLSELGVDNEMRRELVYNFTGGRETSSSKMEFSECHSLIKHLEQMKKGSYRQQSHDLRSNKMRKKVLSICHEMQWELPNGKIDFERLHSFLMKYGYLKKALNDYKYEELPTLVTQFENLLRTYYDTRKNKAEAAGR